MKPMKFSFQFILNLIVSVKNRFDIKAVSTSNITPIRSLQNYRI